MHLQANRILTQRHLRQYIQPYGAGPSNPVYYAGMEGTYMAVGAVKTPRRRAGVKPVLVHDPRVVGRWERVNHGTEPPDLATATVAFLNKRKRLPAHLTKLPWSGATIYEMVSNCWGEGDFNYGWRDWLRILSFGVVLSIDEMGAAFDSDERIEDKLEFTFEAAYRVGEMAVMEAASTTVYSEVVDLVYSNPIMCPDCARVSAETLRIYLLVANNVASPGQPPTLVYTVDGGKNWVEVDLGESADATPTFLEMANQRLIVGIREGRVLYAEVDAKTGVPGGWASVSVGGSEATGPRDAYINSREMWICGNGGYIYYTNDLTAGVEAVESGGVTSADLYRIHGAGNVVVAGGQGGAVIMSDDGGQSWTTPADLPATTADVLAVSVVDEFLWWLGFQDGDIWYSDTSGEAWSSCCLPGPGATNGVSDILFVSAEIGWVAGRTPDAAVVYWTLDGGRSWALHKPRLGQLPTVERFSRLAAPRSRNLNVNVNHLAIGGLHANGSDGVVVLARGMER